MAKARNKIFKAIAAWLASRPHWLKFSSAVFGVSLLSSLLLLGIYDQLWGNSPLSKKSRLVKEAIAICNEAQTLSQNPVDLAGWPLKDTFDIAVLGDAANFVLDPNSFADEDTSSESIFQATTWLNERYGASISEYNSAQTRCDILAQEYQEKYAY